MLKMMDRREFFGTASGILISHTLSELQAHKGIEHSTPIVCLPPSDDSRIGCHSVLGKKQVCWIKLYREQEPFLVKRRYSRLAMKIFENYRLAKDHDDLSSAFVLPKKGVCRTSTCRIQGPDRSVKDWWLVVTRHANDIVQMNVVYVTTEELSPTANLTLRLVDNEISRSSAIKHLLSLSSPAMIWQQSSLALQYETRKRIIRCFQYASLHPSRYKRNRRHLR